MAGVPETLRTGSCLSQRVNLPYMQEGERGGSSSVAAGWERLASRGGSPCQWRIEAVALGAIPTYAAPEQTPPNRRAQATKR